MLWRKPRQQSGMGSLGAIPEALFTSISPPQMCYRSKAVAAVEKKLPGESTILLAPGPFPSLPHSWIDRCGAVVPAGRREQHTDHGGDSCAGVEFWCPSSSTLGQAPHLFHPSYATAVDFTWKQIWLVGNVSWKHVNIGKCLHWVILN